MAAELEGRPRVLLADEIEKRAAERLARTAELVRPAGEPLETAIADVEAVIVRTTPLPRATLEAALRLRVIAKHGVGVDAIDVAYASERGIVVANVPAANAPAVAEFALLAILSLLKPAARGATWLRRDGGGKGSMVAAAGAGGLGGREVGGRTVAILGWGEIGRRVGTALLGLGARVLAFDPAVEDGTVRAAGGEPAASLTELLAEAEILSIHVPLNDATRGLIGAEELAAMPPGALLVNTARGGVVDEAALAAAIERGHLAGAAIDVFATEPPPPDHPLLRLDEVVCTPHLAGTTEESLRRMAEGAVDAVLAVLAGERPAHVVAPQATRR